MEREEILNLIIKVISDFKLLTETVDILDEAINNPKK